MKRQAPSSCWAGHMSDNPFSRIRTKPPLRLGDAVADRCLFVLRPRPRHHQFFRAGRSGTRTVGACRWWCDHSHAGPGLAVDVRGASSAASAVPASSDREIDRSAATLGALVTVCILRFACCSIARRPISPSIRPAVLAGVSASVLGVLTLSFLGRSFSVMPEARRLVTTGPYSIVRHPLYLFELLGVVGILLAGSLAAGGHVAGTHRRAADRARALGRSCPRSRYSGICGLSSTCPVPDPARCAQPFRAAAGGPDGAPPFGRGHELGIRPAGTGRDRAPAAHRLRT